MNDSSAIVSPGGVGYDINWGIRLLRTNLYKEDIFSVKEQLAQSLFDNIPNGVGSKSIFPIGYRELEEILGMGLDWSLKEGYAWAEDKENCEEYGRMMNADPTKVSTRAKMRGLPQLGTLGGGHHCCEIQVVDEIYNQGQICIMIHTGSRGLEAQVTTDALQEMEKVMKKNKIMVYDRQLTCARINSLEGQNYLNAIAAASNFAWVNRSLITFQARQTVAKQFNTTPDDLDMHVIYDVGHNIAKEEIHFVDGEPKRLLLHRNEATRSFHPHHPLIPVDVLDNQLLLEVLWEPAVMS